MADDNRRTGPSKLGVSDFMAALADALSPEQYRDMEVVVKRNLASQQKIRQGIGTLQDSLDTTRLSVKYLMFDLEATRCESALLREQVLKQYDAIAERDNEIAQLRIENQLLRDLIDNS